MTRKTNFPFTGNMTIKSFMSTAGNATNRFLRSPVLQVFSLYGLIALGLLSPMASNRVFPAAPDHVNATRLIVQAKMALHERQFPLRIAPWQFDGRRYPVYQFYSPLPYTLGGALYKWVFPWQPFLAYKTMLWGALVLGGLSASRLIRWLTNSQSIGIVAGVLYMASPYFLVNIHARGAFAEAVAQGLLPVVAYATLRCFRKGGLCWLAAGGVAWTSLAMTHLITFVYMSLFAGLLVLGAALLKLRRQKTWQGLCWTGAAYGAGLLLCLYYLAPIVDAEYLGVSNSLHNPMRTNWLTPIAMLLAPTAVSPEPLPGHSTTPFLYAGIGLPVLAAVAICWYGLINGHPLLGSTRHRRFIGLLLALFLLDLVMTWSPFDFWRILPKPLWICQFTYRLVAQMMWIGLILSGFALKLAFGRSPNHRQVIATILAILIANSHYLPPLTQTNLTMKALVAEPDMGYGRYVYLPILDHPRIARWAVTPEKLIRVETIREAFTQRRTTTHGELTIAEAGETYVQLPVFFYPKFLDVRVDGVRTAYSMHQGLVAVKLDQGKHSVDVAFVGLPWANRVCAVAWLAVALIAVTGFFRERRRRQALNASLV